MPKMTPHQARRFAALANELFNGRLSVACWDAWDDIESLGGVRNTRTFDMRVHEYASGGAWSSIRYDERLSTPGVNVMVDVELRKIVFNRSSYLYGTAEFSWQLVPTEEDDGLYDSFVELHKIAEGIE